MSSTSSAAAALTRPRIAVAVVSAVAAASAGYYCFVQYRRSRPDAATAGAGLHRSNAVRRPRRRSLLQDDLSDTDAPPGDENMALVPVGTDGHTDDQDWYNDPSQSPRQRSGENIVTLLFRVSEDNARRNAYVHRGCQCNGCGMVPIRGIRYRCANCADFDLCEACESQSLHYRTHVFYKVRVPAPPFGPRQVQPAWYPGDPDTAPRTLPRHLLAKWSNETGFERVELDAFWEQWTFIANTEWRDDPTGLCLAMDRKTFERCLVPSGGYKHAAPNLIHDRMFAFYDTNHDDLIGFEEFLHGVSYRKRKDKLARTFEGYDIDGDGYVCRKDFLRMFRAYYVLYKQMHRDILEGLDDYMMSTTEAQQLVNGRAPLSSLFGREGRVPGGDHSRPQEGKVFRSNGEVDVHDGRGVVNKDKPDTASREEILSGLFSRHNNQSAFTESFGTTSRRTRSPNSESSRYWTGLLNPPQNMAGLTSLVNGEVNLDDILSSLRSHDSTSHALETRSASSDDQERPTPAENADSDLMDSLNTARYARRSDTNRFTTTLAPEGQLRTQHHTTVGSSRLSQERRKRIQVRKQLLERWKRRQFYLDEEEGGLPPQGWKESEDVLEDLTNVAGPSKEPPMLSSRPRSSSKVRFADDDDDLDTRSNPSTSSRSIPERWGGMEIPDAERDAGKEILYQVTQQAFNELLDDIFKRKEDLAVQCAQTKEERNKYRHLFDNIQLEAVSTTPPDENAPRGNRPVQQQSLEELLRVSGYTVDPAALRARSSIEPASEDAGPSAPESREAETRAIQPATTTEPTNVDTPATYRDPTMPQFRPNTESDSVSVASVQPESTCSESSSLVTANVSRGQPAARTQSGDSSDSHAEPAHIPHSTLVTWKRLDEAETEARARGGWGKLNFEEFEDIYREHELHENNRNRLDYLGSWIDFCIP